MEQLIDKLETKILELPQKHLELLSGEILDRLYSVYPFNKFEYIISHLIADGVLSIEEYYTIRNSYLNRNKYLYVFEITAPRTFGEDWAQRHLNEVVPELQRPTKDFDPDYVGQYDFWYDSIKIEVKASRAVKRTSGESLIIKALSSDSKLPFDMNFQQIKPHCCHVFVWIGVWRDRIVYWVLSNKEVESNKYFSKGQHRGNVGEGQLWIKNTNISEFDKYKVDVREILNNIRKKYLTCDKI